jgi:hypothetical protein
MEAGALGFLMLSGWMAITNGAYDALLWPLSKTKCRPGQKMTTNIGCQDLDSEPTGPTGRIVASACSVLSVCAASLFLGATGGSLFSACCCAVVLIAGIVQAGIPQPAPQRQPARTPKQVQQ